MRLDVLTLFPDLFTPFLNESIVGRAVRRGLVDIRVTNIRDFARGPHHTTDDRPYGGGNGMVMKPGPIYRALQSIERVGEKRSVILLTPQGIRFEQSVAWELSGTDQLVLICGRYEGVDERIKGFVDLEISIGDYVLTGGELPAMIVADAVIRLIPGVLGGEKSNLEDSFAEGLLEYPHYTRPRVFQDEEVPEVLLSGDHERIRKWRRAESIRRTLQKRPDLLEKKELNQEDRKLLARIEEELKEAGVKKNGKIPPLAQ
ncbi:MAG: tRNA (guanosine(37)-N1)-methyltransferase TrmD [Desulfobacteraceae bacterium]|nr:MAG: tRNA (guanosine(37)-N1)-methyltransferase TrmD [Desulfobacteraceae bacterium]